MQITSPQALPRDDCSSTVSNSSTEPDTLRIKVYRNSIQSDIAIISLAEVCCASDDRQKDQTKPAVTIQMNGTRNLRISFSDKTDAASARVAASAATNSGPVSAQSFKI